MSAGESSLTARAKEVFADALEKREGGGERAAFVAAACAGDAALREQVEALLAAHGSAARFMYSPSVSLVESAAAAPLVERPGTVIGRYRLLELIGEGGFGSVFLAEQREPVVRQVALKVIKLGMDTRQVIARFEAERQALAMMDHPNIAKVLDAGATDTGRPYFVMELVRGRPITEHCDAGNLGVRERLELFEQVCHAVQHAHQKGIIHRDIKPRNVLVSVTDGRAIPRVIDFGVAKATAARLAEKSFFTEHRTLIGTPEYMSPEQAEMRSGDVDTRSDIYSLGVLLYELLTGSTPFDAKELREAAFGEIQRIIRDVEPPKPSTRLSTMKDALPSVAAHRQTEPARLPGLVKGDLDWIVMKCLEKDRARRYDTAEGLALEVRRHLSGEPVLAAPPGRGYRPRKFVRRHRVGVLAGATIGAALVVGLVGASVGFVQARAQRDRAEQIAEFMEDMLRGAGATLAPGRDSATLRDMVDGAAERIRRGELKDSPEAELRLRVALGKTYQLIGAGDAATGMLDPALPLARALARGGNSAVAVYQAFISRADRLQTERAAEAEALYLEALEVLRRRYPGDHADLARTLSGLSWLRKVLWRDPDALPLQQESTAMYRRLHQGDHHDVANALNGLGMDLLDLGRPAEAEPVLVEALAMRRRLFKGDHPFVAGSLHGLGEAREQLGRMAEAEALYTEAYEMRRRRAPGKNGYAAHYLCAIARLRARAGQAAEAESKFREALVLANGAYSAGDLSEAEMMRMWAEFLVSQGRPDEARPVAERAAAKMAAWPRKTSNQGRKALAALLAELGLPAPEVAWPPKP